MTLGFAAATTVAANAQEVMTEEEVQTQTEEVVNSTEAEVEMQTEETVESVEDGAADTEEITESVVEEAEYEVDQMTDEATDATSQTEEYVEEDMNPTVGTDEMQEETTQPQASNEQIGEEGGVMNITQEELPAEVMRSLQESEFAQATIEATYLLDEYAVDKMTANDAKQKYIGDQLPEKLYQIRVSDGEQQTLLYFEESGELYGSESI